MTKLNEEFASAWEGFAGDTWKTEVNLTVMKAF